MGLQGGELGALPGQGSSHRASSASKGRIIQPSPLPCK